MSDLLDIDHSFGGDLGVSNTGDLAAVQVIERSQQRVLRRLLTNPGGYIFHLGYGAGVPQYVGAVLDLAAVETNVSGQMKLEASVSKNPGPIVTTQPTTDGVSVDVSYLVASDRQPASLNFDVNA